MCDSIQKKILNALLDKYEHSTFFRDEKQPTRRIMLIFYEGGKSDFPYYDIEQSDRRISVKGGMQLAPPQKIFTNQNHELCLFQ